MIAVGSRYWNANEGASPEKVINFVKRIFDYADMAIIAINVAEDKSGAVEALKNLGLGEILKIVPVQPWGFTSAMNALVRIAHQESQSLLLSQSIEIAMDKNIIDKMRLYMDDETMYVGARLPGHNFYPGKTVEGRGTTIPWNTCSLINLKRIPYIGYPLIGDASFDPSYAGVEELTTIALHQMLYFDCKAKLVEIPGIEWKTEFESDPGRRLKQDKKIRTKDVRPEIQMALLGIKKPIIEHILDTL